MKILSETDNYITFEAEGDTKVYYIENLKIIEKPTLFIMNKRCLDNIKIASKVG